jgi:heptosyltransferase-1
MDRILIVRTGSLGDIVHTLPAVATLKRAFPRAELDWVVERQWAPVLARNPHLARVHQLETRAWRRTPASSTTWRSVFGALRALRERRYDCALDFQGLVKSAAIARLSGAATVVGFDRGESREGASALFYTSRVRPQSDGRPLHVVERNLAIAAAVGATEVVLEFPAPPAEEDIGRIRATTPGAGRYAVLSPSAGWDAKRWPQEAYAALASRVAQELSLPVIINCGPGEERVAGRVVELAAEARPRLLKPSVGELMALLRDAALVVGGDTGPVHLAAAYQVPVVAIFGPTDPLRNGPFGARCRVVRSQQATTTYSRRAGREAISGVSVESVFNAITELLG